MGGGQAAIVAVAYQDHGDGLRRYLATAFRAGDDADDLTQEAFLRLAREVEAGRTPDNVRAWLFRTATNLATSRWRRRAVAERRSGELGRQIGSNGDGASAEEITLRSIEHADLHVALAELPAVDRTALLLAAEGYGGAEIARLLGRTNGATRTLLYRARERLRVRLVPAGHPA